jgi:prepilin-type N-terminal cleavage/methylation domain-containing protein
MQEHYWRKKNGKRRTRSGFTLVELVVSIGIFAFMTALFVAKYGTFNESVLLTNLAYDVALTVRTAQTYGLSIKGVSEDPDPDASFRYSYGVDFSKDDAQRIILFATQTESNLSYDYDAGGNPQNGDAIISSYNVKRGAVISQLCAGNGPGDCTDAEEINITFRRPDPGAHICARFTSIALNCDTTYPYAEIHLKATDEHIRTVTVRGNGQIAVKQ